MQDNQYPEMSDDEYQAMVNSPLAKEIETRVENRMKYLHHHFFRSFYNEFPEFYKYILWSEDSYLMEDLWDRELRAIPSPIMWTLLRYIEILIKNQDIDEVKDILAYLEQWYQSEDPQVKDLIIGFVNDIYIVPDVLHALVKLLPPGMHKHFMEYNSDLL